MSTRTTAKAQDAGPLVVCCARAEADAIRSALAEMEALGHTLEIVAGVEEDPKLLTPVIERLHGDGLYVLCRSKLLGRDTVEQLREILLTHHVPFGRTVTVATQRPSDLVDRIKASVARSGTRRSSQAAEETVAGPAPARSEPAKAPVRPAGAAAVRRPTLVATPAALALSRVPVGRRPATPRDAAFEEAITGAQKVVPREEAASAEPDSDDAFDPPTIELPSIGARGRALSEPTDPELSAISLTDAAIEVFEEDVETDDEPDEIVDPLHDPRHDIESSLAGVNLSSVDFSDLERADSGRIALEGLSVPVRTGNTSVSAPPSAPARELSPIPGPPSPAPVRSGATAPPPGYTPRPTTMAAPALPHAGAEGSSRAAQPATTPATPRHSAPPTGFGPLSSPGAAAASMSPAMALDDEDDAPRSKLVWAAGLGAVAVIAVVVALMMGDGDEPEGEVAKADAAEADAAKADDATPPGSGEASPPGPEGGVDDTGAAEVAPEPADEALAAVGSALSDRKVRALDILLVQPASAGPMTHGDAQAYCEALDLAGLQGWRLPEVGELYSLSEAGMVGPSVYWSCTAGDTFGDSHLAWHGRRKRVQHESGKSRVLCVHGERAAL